MAERKRETPPVPRPQEPCDVLLLAAGRGERLGFSVPKCRVPLNGQPLFLYSLRTLRDHPSVGRIILLAPPEDAEMRTVRSLVQEAFGTATGGPEIRVIPGGEERQDSVWAGLNALQETDPPGERIVLIHDAARPLVRDALVSACLQRMALAAPATGQAELPGLSARGGWGSGPAGVVPGLPIRETLKLVYDDRIVLTQPRQGLFAVQTPQVFRLSALWDAHWRAREAGMHATDDAALLEWEGIPVFIVPGDSGNLKITYPEDLEMVVRLLRSPVPMRRDARAAAPGSTPGSKESPK